MPNLGSQFDNTYFIDNSPTNPSRNSDTTQNSDEWHDHYEDRIDKYLRGADAMSLNDIQDTGVREGIQRKARRDADKAFPQTKNPIVEFRNPYKTAPMQGMLFHPATGTMTKDDPTYNKNKRTEDIRTALKLPKSAANDRIVSYVQGTDIPTPMLSKKVVGLSDPDEITNVSENASKIRGGEYSIGKHAIKLSGELADRTEKYNASNFSHEWGHKEDYDIEKERNLNKRLNPRDLKEIEIYASVRGKGKARYVSSPVLEGVADAYSDRYAEPEGESPMGKRHGATLDPAQNPERHKDLWRHSMTHGGYGVDFEKWKDKHEMALYAATRLHVANGGKDALRTLPDMDKLAETHLLSLKDKLRYESYVNQAKPGNSKKPILPAAKEPAYQSAARHLYLGQLVTENPAIHEQLHHLGLGEVANYSKDFYNHHVNNTPLMNRTQIEDTKVLHVTDRSYGSGLKEELYSSKPPGWELQGTQHTLPGMEEHDPLVTTAAANPMPKPLSKKQLARTDTVAVDAKAQKAFKARNKPKTPQARARLEISKIFQF